MNKFKLSPSFGLIPLFLIAVAITISNSSNNLYRNLAYLNLSKALVSDHVSAEFRQARLQDYFNYIYNPQSGNISPPSIDENPKFSMLTAIFIGEYYRYQGNWNKAAQWYLTAVKSDPFPVLQDSLSSLRKDKLLPDGTYKIDDLSNANHWRLVPPTNVKDITLESSDGILTASYKNNLNKRDRLVYSIRTGSFELGYHNILSTRVKLEPGTYLTIDAKIDDELKRYLRNYPGSGEWETLLIPLAGSSIHYIIFDFSERKKSAKTPIYQASVDWIKLEPSGID